MEESFGLKDYSDSSRVLSTDPVCGMAVDQATAPAKTEYAGEVFYFCSKACQKNFELDPKGYSEALHKKQKPDDLSHRV